MANVGVALHDAGSAGGSTQHAFERDLGAAMTLIATPLQGQTLGLEAVAR